MDSIPSVKNEDAEVNIIKEGGEKEIAKVASETAENGAAAAPKWDQLDEMGLPIIDKAKDPQTAKEVEIVRNLVKQERSHGQWKKQGINLIALFLLLANSLLRGKVFDRCSPGDWTSLALFIIFMTIQVYISCKLTAYE